MYNFTLTGYKDNPLFDAYVDSIIGVNDDFWEEHVLDSKLYCVEASGQSIGLCGINNQENLTFFYVQPIFLRHAQLAFNVMLDLLKPKYAFVPTNDELFASLCLDRHVKVDLQAYFWKHSGAFVRPPEYPRELLTLAVPGDESDMLDIEGVAENIALGKYYVMRDNGIFLGQGFFNRHVLIPNSASIGMSVHPDFRQRGVGRSIIMHLVEICREKGITPYCGCWYYNHNSKATLESAGFVTQTRLLKIWFS